MNTPGVVLPEAVELDLRAAGIASRGLAQLVDWLIIFVGLIVLAFASTAVAVAVSEVAAVVVMSIGAFVLTVGYFAIFETAMRGRTPGKAALGLRVVTVEGAPVRFRHAAIRGALTLVDILMTFGGAAVLTALLTKRGQRLGDLAAGTIVLRERGGEVTARHVVPPRGAEAYAATIDVTGLDAASYAAIRELLGRDDLEPDVRRRAAETLATPVTRAIGHRPPDGTPAELFLTCVMARAQQRSAPPQPAVQVAEGWGGQAPPSSSGAAPPSFRPPSQQGTPPPRDPGGMAPPG